MPFPFYPRQIVDEPVADAPAPALELPDSRASRQGTAKGYQPDAGLVDAVNVALLLGQPLLLTGEPGTGKTGLAYHLAWNLGLPAPLVFESKSSSTARDLFYTFDTVGRFRADASKDSRDYISYEALGLAILLANQESDVRPWLPAGFKHPGARRSVVLIDEVDKAPRDFPNDILTEVERLRFRVPEIRADYVEAPEPLRPVLVITSNSEKHLPDAFLRRCIYYDIPFPTGDRLVDIVASRVRPAPPQGPYLDQAIEYFSKLRDPAVRLRKPPATAELLGWMDYLGKRITDKSGGLKPYPDILKASLSILVKSADDQKTAAALLEDWTA